MKVALDLEGIMADSHLTLEKVLVKKYGISLRKRPWYQWNIREILKHTHDLEISSEEHADLWVEAWQRPQEIPVLDQFTPKVIEAIRQLGHEVDIVTASFPGSEEGKEEWIRKHIPQEVNVVHSDGKKYLLNYDLFIDDAPHNIVGATVRGKKTILYTRPWNMGVSDEWYTKRISQLYFLIMQNALGPLPGWWPK